MKPSKQMPTGLCVSPPGLILARKQHSKTDGIPKWCLSLAFSLQFWAPGEPGAAGPDPHGELLPYHSSSRLSAASCLSPGAHPDRKPQTLLGC
ncbi:rCG47429 [Rattus norvegicus]|uniref:RCG47429 n=1 Tax=Rattus norvegicus TaxID=10116 RepID=A6HYH1_RAT|nr:rCG47429 [Rattus norvegicus]